MRAASASPVQRPAEQAVSAAAFSEWVRRAEPGQRLVYFTGLALIQSLEVVKAVRGAAERGEVLMTQQRRSDGLLDYQATRRRNAEPLASSRGRATIADERRDGARTEWETEQLMAVLRGLASRAEACPTNRELAEKALLKDGESVRYRLNLLQIAGRIRIAATPQGVRVVTIVSSGRSTASGVPSGRGTAS